jgi:hypothetical protein
MFQFQSSLRTAFPSILLQLVPLALAPELSRILRGVNPRWLLAGGLIPMAAGQFWLAALPLSDKSLLAVTGPAILTGPQSSPARNPHRPAILTGPRSSPASGSS